MSARILFPNDGPTKMALNYASMKKKNPFTHTDLFKCFHNKFRRPSEANDSLKILSKHGLIEPAKNAWVITEKGHDYLRATAKKYTGHHEEF